MACCAFITVWFTQLIWCSLHFWFSLKRRVDRPVLRCVLLLALSRPVLPPGTLGGDLRGRPRCLGGGAVSPAPALAPKPKSVSCGLSPLPPFAASVAAGGAAPGHASLIVSAFTGGVGSTSCCGHSTSCCGCSPATAAGAGCAFAAAGPAGPSRPFRYSASSFARPMYDWRNMRC
jgi:hypothetical protein